MQRVKNTEFDIFNKSARIIVAGFSGSGKSYLISKLISKYIDSFSAIKVCGVSQLENIVSEKITYYDDDNIVYDPFKDDVLQKRTLVLIDDCLTSDTYTRIALNIFIRGRHKEISCIYIVQNIYHQNKMFRTIALNANYILLLRMRDLRQIKLFASSFLEQSKILQFLDLYSKYVTKRKYGYILIDYSKDVDSPLMLRTNIVNEDKEICIYL